MEKITSVTELWPHRRVRSKFQSLVVYWQWPREHIGGALLHKSFWIWMPNKFIFSTNTAYILSQGHATKLFHTTFMLNLDWSAHVPNFFFTFYQQWTKEEVLRYHMRGNSGCDWVISSVGFLPSIHLWGFSQGWANLKISKPVWYEA